MNMVSNPALLPHPFGFYRAIGDGDALHFGYWPPGAEHLSLAQAQRALSDLVLARLPPPPARVLDVGCGLGLMAGELAGLGYSVTAIAPAPALIAYATAQHPGPVYHACGFLDEHPAVLAPSQYDVLLFQESLQYFPELSLVFERAAQLLEPTLGRLVICDEVSYDAQTRQSSAVHEVREIERCFAEVGFYARHHQRLGTQVAPTCAQVLNAFADHHETLAALYPDDPQGSANLLAYYSQGWLQQQDWYRRGCFGYELWELRASGYQIHGYRRGDEYRILDAFQSVFGVSRRESHWRWKFEHNPFGGPDVSMVWDGALLVAHYTAYPVPVWLSGRASALTYQVGDTLTHPAYRGVGKGQTSLLARAYRHFAQIHWEGQVPFSYGFNTDKIQRFGQLFLNYHPVAPVYEWSLTGAALQAIPAKLGWKNWLQGYRVECTETVGDWADTVFVQAREAYGWLIARTAAYLRWRYQENPDFRYYFFVVYRRHQPMGWWLGRLEQGRLLMGDALFIPNPQVARAARIGLSVALEHMQHTDCTVTEVQGWFSQTPTWWVDTLRALGFTPQRQHQHLDFCVRSFNQGPTEEELGKNFYFTHGDSDLF